MMNPEIKKKWVEALRSGEYKQATGVLKYKNTFCCLGVLTDLCMKEGLVDGEWQSRFWDENEYQYISKSQNVEASYLPLDVMIACEVECNNDPQINHDNFDTLSEINDAKGFGFKRIANIIEKQL